MIEIICNEENSDKSKQVTRGAAIRRPKNIKQIGEVSSDKKIYIEDYAFTYINSIAYNNPSDSQAGVLLGENQTDGDEKCVFIKGIIKAKLGTEVEEKGVYFNESVWNGIYSDVEKYFPDLSVVGWFAAIPEVTPERMMKLKKIHLDNFAGTMKTFYLIDTVEKEENFYLYENGNMENPVRASACRGSGSGMPPVLRPLPGVPAAPAQGQNRVSGKTGRLGTASAHLPP